MDAIEGRAGSNGRLATIAAMNSVTRGFSAFRHPNYQLYFGGQAVSQAGTQMQTVAQAWLVLQMTNSARDLGIVFSLQGFPVLLIGVFGGVFADRMPKRRLMVITQVVEMLLAFALGVLVSTHLVQIWHVYLLAFALGIALALEGPTRQAFVMEMVGRDDLISGLAINASLYNASRIVGPAIAGVLIGIVGVTSSFYINGVSFLFVIAGLLLMRADRFYAVSIARRVSVFRSLSDGFMYVRHTAAALIIIGLVGVLSLSSQNTDVLLPLFAKNILHVGAQGLGLMFSAMGVGSVIAGLAAAVSQKARWSWIVAGALGIGIAEVGFALSRSLPVSLVLMFLTGLCLHTFWTSSLSGIQQRVPDHLRGRVMGIFMTMTSGPTPLGNLAAGGIASVWGAPTGMIAGGLATLAGASSIVGWMFLHRRTADFSLAAEQEPAPDQPPVSVPALGSAADAELAAAAEHPAG